MITHLTGQLISKKLPHIVLDVSGVGYEIEVTLSLFSILPDLGAVTTVATHFQVREDAQVLFGFSSTEERDLFRTLIKVNGIGPKSAILILSGMNYNELAMAISEENISLLTKIPGIGKKTAERLVVELKDKVTAKVSSDSVLIDLGETALGEQNRSDAITGLTSLGYKGAEAEKMISAVYAKDLASDMLIKLALQSKIK